MNIIRKQLLPAFLGAAALCLIGAGLATAKYVHSRANSRAAVAAPATADDGSAGDQSLTVPAETAITVRLDQSLDSGENHSGDTFEAHVAEPVVVDNRVAIPRDTPVRGRVVEAIRSGHLSHPGRLEVALNEIQVDGKWYEISTHDTNRKGGSHRNRDLAWIGGGGVGGALIGGLAGGGKGALIGGPVGAGAGTAVAFLTGKKNVHLPPETRLTFHTSRPLAVSAKG